MIKNKIQKNLFLSVIICTYNRSKLLRECISSVLPQLEGNTNSIVNLIIVDNNSTDDTYTIVKSFNSPKIEYVFEKKQGLSFARNEGYQSTNSEWVAYLDDDALAADNWIKRIFWLIENTDFDAFGGIYSPWYRDGKPSWYLDEYATNKTWMKYTEVTLLEKQRFSGGNCAFRRKLLDDVEGFPTYLGMKGCVTAYGEEALVQEQLRQKGYKLGFDPDLLIKHYVAPYKQTTSWFFKQSKALGASYWLSHNTEPSWTELFLVMRSIPLIMIGNIKISIIKLLKKEYRFTNTYILVGKSMVFLYSKLISGVKQKIYTSHKEKYKQDKGKVNEQQ